MHEKIPLSTCMCLHTEPCRDFLGQECLDHLQEHGKENSRDYSGGTRRVSNSSRP